MIPEAISRAIRFWTSGGEKRFEIIPTGLIDVILFLSLSLQLTFFFANLRAYASTIWIKVNIAKKTSYNLNFHSMLCDFQARESFIIKRGKWSTKSYSYASKSAMFRDLISKALFFIPYSASNNLRAKKQTHNDVCKTRLLRVDNV